MTEEFIKPLYTQRIYNLNILIRNNTENTKLEIMRVSVVSTNRKWKV